ncbi:MAG TPA: [Fe-Fe] hydrogenase large subunit C-terminal domain-containing protein, partial [Syntrophorhabdaceae bacterium]|nr:[Fe-Fe] hydrogenase large subunit C-terminal domain-containing protein [Syntrophorhabdaceae bacterium]
LEEGHFVAASVAPSFATVFTGWRRSRLASAIRMLGFSYIGHVSQGAYQISMHTRTIIKDSKNKPWIGTACPANVNYTEKYRPEFVDNLIPLVSPMVAHARMLKKKLGNNIKVIFIGPCVAKKSELFRPEVVDSVDCVLTFQELLLWFEQRGIDLSRCEESNFDEKPVSVAQLYPLPGGMLKTAGLEDDGLNIDYLKVDGLPNLHALYRSLPDKAPYTLIDPLFCAQGCINGPVIHTDKNLFERRRDIIEFEKSIEPGDPPLLEPIEFFRATYEPKAHAIRRVSEEEIQQILEKSGKSDVQQQLNCGACGYDSCRQKAIAVALGMAEPEMCIPFMRRLAERRTDQIVTTTPNGILMLDGDLNIISMNAAFKKFFYCSDAVLGRHISYLMDPAPFENIITGETDSLDITVTHDHFNLSCRELLYILKEERQIVGIFINITSQEENEKRLNRIKSQTIEQANELLEHQIKMAQTLAQFLGESTARGETLVRKLLTLSEADDKGSE